VGERKCYLLSIRGVAFMGGFDERHGHAPRRNDSRSAKGGWGTSSGSRTKRGSLPVSAGMAEPVHVRGTLGAHQSTTKERIYVLPIFFAHNVMIFRQVGEGGLCADGEGAMAETGKELGRSQVHDMRLRARMFRRGGVCKSQQASRLVAVEE